MLASLIDLTSTGEFEDSGFLCISQAEFLEHDLLLHLQITLPEGQREHRSILCRQPRAHRVFAAALAQSVEVVSDHVLTWPYSQPEVELYFNGRAQDSRTVIGALLASHLRIVGEWFAFWHFINEALFSYKSDLLDVGYGLLAKGPESVMDAYRAVLEEFGIRHSSPPSRQPSWWDGTSWQIEQERLHVLLINESYVVAPEFREIAS